MRGASFVLLVAAAICPGSPVKAAAGGKNPDDYPLRVHVYEVQWHKHPGGYVDGEGRANLFEGGKPRAFDYMFNCSELFRSSMGFETYPARWRKHDAELEILTPVMGKAGVQSECTLKVAMKEAAYYKLNGKLNEEPVSEFKAWMEKHNYDPEHGKNQPTGLNQPEAQGGVKPKPK